MKNVFWIGTALLLLAACGNDDTAPAETTETPVVVEEAPAANVAEPAVEAPAEDEVLEVRALGVLDDYIKPIFLERLPLGVEWNR